MNPLALLIPSVVFFAALLVEALLVDRARGQLRLVIRVNGTRGKSSVTRMIHALLRDAGYTAWAKTTGTEARRLLPDGTEVPIRRLGPGNIREQRSTLLRAVRAGADALVIECNALRPALMAAGGRYIREDVLVITNVRDDHPVEQGSLTNAAAAMARSMAPGATVITTDGVHKALYRSEAKAHKGRCIFPGEAGLTPDDLQDEPRENVACVLAVAEHLGIARSDGMRAIRGYAPDPGRYSLSRWTDAGDRRIIFADALAANDPESTEKLLCRTMAILDEENGASPVARREILVIAHRRDRPDRTLQFVRWALGPGLPGTEQDVTTSAGEEDGRAPVRFSHLVVLGACPLSVQYAAARMARRRGAQSRTAEVARTEISYAESVSSLESLVAAQEREAVILIFAAGNWQGNGAVLREWADRHER